MQTRQSDQSAPKDPRRRRRNYLINPAFQWRYIILMVVSVFLVSSLASVVLFSVLHQQARARVLHLAASNTWENTFAIILAAAMFATLTAAAYGVWSVIITHRIGGPLFVLQRYLTELSAGRYPQIRPLRKKDEFKDLYDVFWRAVDTLKEKKQSELTMLTEARDTARSAVDADDESRRSALESVAVQLEEMCDMTRRALGVETEKTAAAPETDAAAAPQQTPVGVA